MTTTRERSPQRPRPATPERAALVGPADAATTPVGAAERPAFFTAVVVFTGLAFVLPAVATKWDTDADVTNVVLAYLLVLFCAVRLAGLCYRQPAAITRAAFYIFIYVFMALSVLAQITASAFPLSLPGTGAYSDNEIRRGLYSVLLGVVMYEIGSLVMRVRRARHIGDDAVASAPVANRRRWRLSGPAALALGVVGIAFSVYVITTTGLGPFFDSRQAAGNAVLGNASNASNADVYGSASKSGRAFLKVAAQTPVLIALFTILYLKRHRLWTLQGKFAPLVTNVVVLLLILANLVLNNPISNSRFWFGMVAITLASVYLPMQRATGIRWAAVASILVLLFGFTSLQAFRRTGGAQNYSNGFQTDLTTSGTYSEFAMELIGLRYLRHEPHTYGSQFLGGVFVFVPRSVWPSKPEDTGNLVIPYSNPAAPLWLEGEVEGGPIGIALYFLALGALTTSLDARFRQSRPGSAVHAITPVISGLVLFALRGSILTVFGPVYILTASLLVVSRLRADPPATSDPTSAGSPQVAPPAGRTRR